MFHAILFFCTLLSPLASSYLYLFVLSECTFPTSALNTAVLLFVLLVAATICTISSYLLLFTAVRTLTTGTAGCCCDLLFDVVKTHLISCRVGYHEACMTCHRIRALFSTCVLQKGGPRQREVF